MTLSARLLALHVHGDRLTMLFATDEAEIPVSVPVQPATVHALRHLTALHAHSSGCETAPATQVHVDLLLRALAALRGEPACVLVRPGPCPAFWLRLTGSTTCRDLDLDVLDATCLLLSRRVNVEVLSTLDSDWDTALRRLLAEEGTDGTEGAN